MSISDESATVQPLILPKISGSQNAEWRYIHSVDFGLSTEYHVYSGFYSNVENTLRRIKVTKSNNVWSDESAGYPDGITLVGANIVLSAPGHANYYTFLKPTSAYWISSGGGTSTEEVFVPDAKIVNYGGITGLRFEQRGYSAASYELIGPASNSTWTLTSQSNNLQHHISNLSSGTYYLWQDSVLVATLIASARKKVFCNFW